MSSNKRNSVTRTIDEIKDVTMTPTENSTRTGPTGTGTYAIVGETSRFNTGLQRRLHQRGSESRNANSHLQLHSNFSLPVSPNMSRGGSPMMRELTQT